MQWYFDERFQNMNGFYLQVLSAEQQEVLVEAINQVLFLGEKKLKAFNFNNFNINIYFI